MLLRLDTCNCNYYCISVNIQKNITIDMTHVIIHILFVLFCEIHLRQNDVDTLSFLSVLNNLGISFGLIHCETLKMLFFYEWKLYTIFQGTSVHEASYVIYFKDENKIVPFLFLIPVEGASLPRIRK